MVQSKTSIPYQPMAPLQVEQIGPIKIKGNDSLTTACKTGIVDAALEIFDNDPSFKNEPKSSSDNPSAFQRAKTWAQENKNDPRFIRKFGVF